MTLLHERIEARANGATNAIRPLTRPLATDEKGAAAMVRAACISPVCDRHSEAHGLCSAHYSRLRRTGAARLSVPVDRLPPLSPLRFWNKVVKGPGCWEWTGRHADDGYGISQLPGLQRPMQAHRVAYILTYGEPPKGLHLDHFACDNKGCCNPDHVRPVTPRENSLRGDSPASRLAAREACDNGHPFRGTNLAIRRDGTRKCRRCHADYMRSWNARRRSA